MTLFHTCCETLHRSGGGKNEVNERRTVVGGLIGHSTGRRSLSTVGGTHVCPPNRGERSTRMPLQVAAVLRYRVACDKVYTKLCAYKLYTLPMM